MSGMVKSGSGGCGCGGSGTSPGGTGCSCGGSCGGLCATCQDQSFLRPRFFAGQLLTEDDLQRLTDYVAEKNRLHNRALFGEGVVCGLEVTCPPCGGAKVTVQPGYALDCCGNDLVLSCPQELDLNRMIRDLRTALRGGYDCGDPCPPEKKVVAPVPQPAPEPTRPGNVPSVTAPPTERPPVIGDKTPVEIPRERGPVYCLYARYCEEPTDLVAAYATGEDCSGQSCEPTRVREGVRFELACPEHGAPRRDIVARVLACIGDLVKAERTALDGARLLFLADALAKAGNQPLPVAGTAPLDPPSIARATSALAWLQNQLPTTWTEANVNQARVNLMAIGQVFAALLYVSPSVRSTLLGGLVPATAQTAVDTAVPKIDTAQASSALLRAYTEAVLRVVQRAVDALAQNPGAAALTGTEPGAYTLRILAAGQPFDGTLLGDYTVALQGMRADLLRRLLETPHGACSLAGQVEKIALPSGSRSDVSAEDAATLRTATHHMVDAFLALVADCLCAALNPPCQPCDDPRVLLACIEVRDCEVVEICNLSRSYVLSATALRYWLPPLSWLGALLEALCCCGIRVVRPLVGAARLASATERPATLREAPAVAGLVRMAQASPAASAWNLDDLAAFASRALASYYGTGARALDLDRIGAVVQAIAEMAALRLGWGEVSQPSVTPPEKPPLSKEQVVEAVRAELDARRLGAEQLSAQIDERVKAAVGAEAAAPAAVELQQTVASLQGDLRKALDSNAELAKQMTTLRARMKTLEARHG
jgi:hypothetical protein